MRNCRRCLHVMFYVFRAFAEDGIPMVTTRTILINNNSNMAKSDISTYMVRSMIHNKEKGMNDSSVITDIPRAAGVPASLIIKAALDWHHGPGLTRPLSLLEVPIPPGATCGIMLLSLQYMALRQRFSFFLEAVATRLCDQRLGSDHLSSLRT